MVILKHTTETNPTRTARLDQTMRPSITRTVIHSRISRTGTPTPGLIRLTVTTDTSTANEIAAAGSGSEFVCDSFAEASLDTP